MHVPKSFGISAEPLVVLVDDLVYHLGRLPELLPEAREKNGILPESRNPRIRGALCLGDEQAS